MAIGYRVGYPNESVAWKALNFEYEELANWATLSDVSAFLGRPIKDIDRYRPGTWKVTLAEFRKRYGDAEGIWVCDKREDARNLYGVHPLGSKKSDGSQMLEVKYDPKNVIVDLGSDGKFVLLPQAMVETKGNPVMKLAPSREEIDVYQVEKLGVLYFNIHDRYLDLWYLGISIEHLGNVLDAIEADQKDKIQDYQMRGHLRLLKDTDRGIGEYGHDSGGIDVGVRHGFVDIDSPSVVLAHEAGHKATSSLFKRGKPFDELSPSEKNKRVINEEIVAWIWAAQRLKAAGQWTPETQRQAMGALWTYINSLRIGYPARPMYSMSQVSGMVAKMNPWAGYKDTTGITNLKFTEPGLRSKGYYDPSERILYLDWLWVKPAMRLIGQGRRVYSELEDWAKKHKAQEVVIEAHREAIPFWEKMGFEVNDDSADRTDGFPIHMTKMLTARNPLYTSQGVVFETSPVTSFMERKYDYFWTYKSGLPGVESAAGYYNTKTKKALIFSIKIEDERQRQGIGRKLVQALEAFLKEQGIKSVRGHAGPGSEPFHEAMGYTIGAKRSGHLPVIHKKINPSRPLLGLKLDKATGEWVKVYESDDRGTQVDNFLREYSLLARRGKLYPSYKVDLLFNSLKEPIGRLLVEYGQQARFGSLGTERVFTEIMKVGRQFDLAKTRSDKVLAIDAFAHLEHLYGSAVPVAFNLRGIDAFQYSEKTYRVLQQLFGSNADIRRELLQNPSRPKLELAERDVLLTLHKLKSVRAIQGVGSYYNTAKTYPGDIDFVVKLKVPFNEAHSKELKLLEERIIRLKSYHEGPKTTDINIFVEDSRGKAINSAWFQWPGTWEQKLHDSYIKNGGGAGIWQDRWKRKPL